MQDSQHSDPERGPCLPRKIDSFAQVIFSISQTEVPWLSFKAVNLSVQMQGDTRLSSMPSFCLFISRKWD